jgi:phosphoribosyl 1,2-cyclic phosphodiesterase
VARLHTPRATRTRAPRARRSRLAALVSHRGEAPAIPAHSFARFLALGLRAAPAACGIRHGTPRPVAPTRPQALAVARAATIRAVRIQVLSSGSEGNSTLVRAGELAALVDAGLGREAMQARLETARLAPKAVRHVLVTHAHLDHARSAGLVAKQHQATLHASDAMLHLSWARRAKRCAALPVGGTAALEGERGDERLSVRCVPIPHDCDPTLAFRLEHEGRVAAILTDRGRPARDVAKQLAGAHVLVLEFNHDPELMRRGPYPPQLQRRITGDGGHLSNAQGGQMLEWLASEHLHTLVLAHLSTKTNRPELALEAAHAALERLGLLGRVRVVVARQDEPLECLAV